MSVFAIPVMVAIIPSSVSNAMTKYGDVGLLTATIAIQAMKLNVIATAFTLTAGFAAFVLLPLQDATEVSNQQRQESQDDSQSPNNDVDVVARCIVVVGATARGCGVTNLEKG